MQVIMLKDHKDVGIKNELVEVADGFGQNFLINKGFAILATPENLERRAKKLDEEEKDKKEEIEKSESLKIEIEDIILTISREGHNGKMFGSITTAHISEELDLLNIDVPKKKIKLTKIYGFGSTTAIIDCGNGHKAELNIEIEEG